MHRVKGSTNTAKERTMQNDIYIEKKTNKKLEGHRGERF